MRVPKPALTTPPARLAGPKELTANHCSRSLAVIRSFEASVPGRTRFSVPLVWPNAIAARQSGSRKHRRRSTVGYLSVSEKADCEFRYIPRNENVLRGVPRCMYVWWSDPYAGMTIAVVVLTIALAVCLARKGLRLGRWDKVLLVTVMVVAVPWTYVTYKI